MVGEIIRRPWRECLRMYANREGMREGPCGEEAEENNMSANVG